MKKISCVFLCGDRSPYGMAHLTAIAEHFDLNAIIVADRTRWSNFRRALSGGDMSDFKKISARLLTFAEAVLRKPLEVYGDKRQKSRLNSFGVPVIEINDANSEHSIALISSYLPELILSAAYPQIFSIDLIAVAPRGAINFHPSLLPRFRGAHPHYWCIASGEQFGGVTAHYMTKEIDDGDIIAQRSFDMTGLYYPDVYKKIVECTPALVADVANFLSKQDARAIPQDKSLASIYRNDREIHRRLDFDSMDSRELHNRIRAGDAYIFHQGKRVIIDRADIVDYNRNMTNNIQVPPGVIVDISESGVIVSTKDNVYIVLKMVRWGRRSRVFSDWVIAFDIRIGANCVS